mgnify:CR=1 FL=1
MDLNLFLNSTVLSRDRFFPCLVKIGTNKTMIIEITETSIVTEKIDDKASLNLNLDFKSLLNGFTIKDNIKAIKIYSRPNFISKRNNTTRAKNDNTIIDFTNSFEFIFN